MHCHSDIAEKVPNVKMPDQNNASLNEQSLATFDFLREASFNLQRICSELKTDRGLHHSGWWHVLHLPEVSLFLSPIADLGLVLSPAAVLIQPCLPWCLSKQRSCL